MSKKKQQTTKDLARRGNTDVAVPDFLKTGAEGTDTIGINDVVVPRLKIVQGQTTAKDINDALRDGDWYNSATAQSLGKEIEMFVLLKWNSRVLFDKSFKFLATEYLDVNTKKLIRLGSVDINAEEYRDQVMDCFNYMTVLASDLDMAIKERVFPEVYIYSAGSAAQKPARNLNGCIQRNGRKDLPIYAQLVKVATSKEKFNEGSAFMPVFHFPRFANPTEFKALAYLYKKCREMQSDEKTHYDPESQPEKEPAPPKATVSPATDPDVNVDDPFGNP